MSKNCRWLVTRVDSAELNARYGEGYTPRHADRVQGGMQLQRAAIWTALGLTKQDWEQSLESAQFFTKAHLAALDEIGERQLSEGLHKAWGADYEANHEAAGCYLRESGEQFFQARDDEGHAFKYMPMMWEAALAAERQTQPEVQP